MSVCHKTTFPNESIEYIVPSWDHMHELAFNVSEKLRADGHIPQRLLTLAKGGWPMSLALVDFLKISHVASIGVRFYSGIDTRLPKPEIYQEIPVSLKGEHVLLFDDVADTGESMIYVKEHLEKLGVLSVVTASLYVKPHSSYIPDYVGEETNAWIIFPYDTWEFMEIKEKEWREKGISQEEIRNRFHTLKFPSEWISAYFKHLKR